MLNLKKKTKETPSAPNKVSNNPEDQKPNMFGRKSTIKIKGGFKNMHEATISLRAAVMATQFPNPLARLDEHIKYSASKEAYAMKHNVLQPEPTDTLKSIQAKIDNAQSEAGRSLTWLRKLRRDIFYSRRIRMQMMFDELESKFGILIVYKRDGGEIIIACNGRHEGREHKITELISMSLNQHEIPFTVEYGDTFL